MSFAFMPWYTGDYLRDTRHLSPLKHGVYLLLLAHCWDQKGPLPLDEQECAGIANCRSTDEVEALRYVLNRFFTKMDDGWYNRRIQREVEKANAISEARSDAGRKGYEARARQLLGKRHANARQVHLPPPPPPDSQPPLTLESTTPSGKPDAVAILDFLNAKAGRTFKPVRANLELIEARLKEGATPDECRAVIAKKCREWKGSDMAAYLRPATLFNRTKFAQYQGELRAVS